MKKNLFEKKQFSGIMEPEDFKQWYTYVKWRLEAQLLEEEVSFLMGKASFFYPNFEKMYQVPQFLLHDSHQLDLIYDQFGTEKISFDNNGYGPNQAASVSLVVTEDAITKNYEIKVPWKFKKGKDAPPAPETKFLEWKRPQELQEESAAMIAVQTALSKLIKDGFISKSRTPLEVFRKITDMHCSDTTIYPIHLKNCLYHRIHQCELLIRNVQGYYHIFISNA